MSDTTKNLLGTSDLVTAYAHANLDAFYGPYNSPLEACSKVKLRYRKQGLTIGVIERGEVVEYQWKTEDLTDEGLKKKTESFNLTIAPVGNTTISKDEGEVVTILFSVSGKATIQKGFLYQVIGNSEVFIKEFTNISKGSDNSVEITNLLGSGVYSYRIKILDSSGAAATTAGGDTYIEYEIRYGGISSTYNFVKLNTIPIKNIYSVAGQYFTCNINTRDNSFVITSMEISDGSNVNIALTPCDSTKTPSGTYLGNNYYFLPDSNTLAPLDGKMCYIVLKYKENGTSFSRSTDLFTLLNVGSIEIIPESTTETYYYLLPQYFSFLILTGAENISVVLSKNDSSDFDFETVTVASYKRFSLRVTPNTIKNNAKIVFNYSFYYNNVEYSSSQTGRSPITLEIGNILNIPQQTYYNPSPNTMISRDLLIYSNNQDYTINEDGQYYKVIDVPITETYSSCAFLVDIYCRINKVDDKTIKYLTINYGNDEVGYITEEEIKCRTITTDTPLNEWVQIGLGYNLYEEFQRGDLYIKTSYYAIYINGMVVKTIPIDENNAKKLTYDSNKTLSITFNNGINVLKCLVYYKNNATETLNPNTDVGSSIIYNNYLQHNTSFSEPTNLPTLKLLKITDLDENERYFNLINAYKRALDETEISHTTTFGVIGIKKASGFSDYAKDDIEGVVESPATLFRQTEIIKSSTQKQYAVLCRGLYIVNGVNLLEGVIVEVHTQGTSTLVYSVPNFKFTFWKEVNGGIEHYYPNFIESGEVNGEKTYYHEYIYTAKCDYMDSSHLNNTPTCNFYNNLILKLISEGNMEGSPSARTGGIDAIMGFPIIMEISDSANSFDAQLLNIGSFMFNIDKTGESLGFEVDLNGQHLSCLSFEGTSNDNEHGAAGRFVLDGNLQYFANEAAIDSAYQLAKTAVDNKQINAPDNTVKIEDLSEYPYLQWCQFLSEGLEYRYPDSDIIKAKNNKVTKIMKLNDFKKLYRVWSWVSQSDTYNLETYKAQFEQYFDLKYCMLYFIQLMVFGQTDNLGKNAMFDCWDGEHWYPRPYDLDSQAGLDNNGNDNVAPFVEIKPEFSLDWSNTYTEEEKRDKYLLIDSKVPYGSYLYDRYHYSSNTTKLWINFYNNYKTEIETFYALLRNSVNASNEPIYNYTAESIIKFCEDSLISTLGISQYNLDFRNKYLGNNDLTLAYGNRWNKFKKWMQYRFAFCDSYFHTPESVTYGITNLFTYNIKVNSPQYVVLQYLEQGVITKFVIDQEVFTTGSQAATQMYLKVNQDSVLNTSIFKYVYRKLGPNAYTGLINLDVSGNNLITNVNDLVGNYLPNIKSINISDSTVNTILVPLQTKTLVAKNVTLSSLTFDNNCLIEEIDLEGATLNGNVEFSNLKKLKRLNLKNCKVKSDITLADLESIELFVTEGANFEGDFIVADRVNIDTFDFSGLYVNSISFSGSSNLEIHTLNFHNTTFGLSTLNLNAVSHHLQNLYMDGCKVLEHLEVTGNNRFNSLLVFSIATSDLKAVGSNNTRFDASVFNNMANLQKVSSYLSNGKVTLTPFNFLNATNIVSITNLTWNGSGKSLFEQCTSLESITGTLTLTEGIDKIFYKCTELSSIPAVSTKITILNSVTTATHAFVMANNLMFGNIISIIKKCTKVKDFSNACQCIKLEDNQIINLDTLFQNNTSVENISMMFCLELWGNYALTSVVNNIKIEGKIPSTVKDASRMFMVQTSEVPFDIFSNASSIEKIDGTFCNSVITFSLASGLNILPIYTDSHGERIVLTNTINSSFFPQSVKSMIGVFYNTNVLILEDTIFNRLTNLEDCSSAFGGSIRKFSIVDSNGDTIDLDLDISNLWINNKNLKKVCGCFANVYNVYCTGLNFHSNVTSVDISGLFGLSNSTYRDTCPININIDTVVPTIVTDNYYSTPGNTTNYQGVFENRAVHIQSNSGATQVFSKLSSNCRGLFKGANIYVDSNITGFDLSNVKSAINMFNGASVYKYSTDFNHIYDDTDRYFITINMPTNCTDYTSMFANSYVLLNLPNIRAALAQTFTYTFSNCYINQQEVRIPANYFNICKDSLQRTDNMFYNNLYITELLYNETTGLLGDCNLLYNVEGMFNECHYLHKGIPNNLFGTSDNTNITSLKNMFRATCVFYDIEDNSFKWVDSSTFAPLTGLQSIEGLFSYHRPVNVVLNSGYANSFRSKVNNVGQLVPIIAPDTFAVKTIRNINEVFAFSPIADIPFKFAGFESGVSAFHDSAITGIDAEFIFNQNISRIKDVSGMFYDITQTPVKTVSNLKIFIDKLKAYSNIRIANIAGNLVNNDIESSLKAADAVLSNKYYIGFNMTGRVFYNN